MGKALFMLDASGNAVPAGTGSYLKATSAILQAGNWNDALVQTVSVENVTADKNTCHVFMSPEPWCHDRYADCGIRCTAQGDGTLSFMATSAPESDLTVSVMIAR